MRNLLIPSVLVMITILTFPPILLAQWSPRDLSGTWIRINTPDSNSDTFTFEEPPMTPWGEKRYQLIREGVEGFDQAREDLDQMVWPYCMVPGTPRAYTIRCEDARSHVDDSLEPPPRES